MNDLPYSSGSAHVMPRRGPTGMVLRLRGTTGSEQHIEWAPVDRRQCEVEIRARLMSCNCALAQIPIVRVKTELGHAEATWTEPPALFAIVAGTPVQRPSLPARGAVWRLNVRELRLTFYNAGVVAGAPWTEGDLQVTIQPAAAMQLPTYPYQDIAFPVAAVQHLFPMEAREWRLTDVVGLPVAPAAVSVIPTGSAGALLGAVDAAAVADFRPIPHDAVGWVASARVYAAYR